MTKPDAARMDWMRHALLLDNDRLRKPHGLSETEIYRLRWMIRTQQAVIVAYERDLPLPPPLDLVAAYLCRYAELQLARRKLGERGFYAGTRGNRRSLARALGWEKPYETKTRHLVGAASPL